MGLVLDTSAIIGWLELRDPAIRKLIEERSDDELVVPFAAIAELRRGVEMADGDLAEARQRLVDFVAAHLSIRYPTGTTCQHWAAIAGTLPRRVGHNEAWMAAIARDEDSTLVTQDADLAAALGTIDKPRVLLSERGS